MQIPTLALHKLKGERKKIDTQDHGIYNIARLVRIKHKGRMAHYD